MNKIENYLGIANHDIQMANDSEELKSYVASILCEIDELQQENKQLKEHIEKYERYCKTTGIKELMENTKYKEAIDKAIEYINDNLIISSILDGKKYYTINNYSFDYRELLDILNEVSE